MKRTLLLSLVMTTATDKLVPKLSQAWAKDFCPSSQQSPEWVQRVTNALTRTLPLLQEDPNAVPFVCRYRTDVIQPLTVPQIHQLSHMIQKHQALESLRNKILERLDHNDPDPHLVDRIQTCVSKSDLEDIYAPYKPPSKGSLEVRLTAEHPALPAVVEALWQARGERIALPRNVPREAIVTLLANRIASHLPVMDASLAFAQRHGRIRVTQANSSKKDDDNVKRRNHEKYDTYHDFESSFSYIKDYQVLAIRRGVAEKQLKLGFDVDGDRAASVLKRALADSNVFFRGNHDDLWMDAVGDAWSRLIRKRCTSRLWNQVSSTAEERAMTVFCENLRKALLAPPMQPARPVLALDPGFQAGIKCVLLDENGKVDEEIGMKTVRFANGDETKGKEAMSDLVKVASERYGEPVIVALGNGHGTQEARQLVSLAAEECKVKIEIQLVNEAGASVWSVTESASREFPNQKPAAIASVSIGRRLQNPLPELVKIPPRSLGLGMYQHDMNEKELDDKLHTTSVDAVAEVGVDVNACSLEILEKVPGLTASLCGKIMKARPLKRREDLLAISGLGPKTYENCAAFLRVSGGEEPLDNSLVHPESYDVARWLLRKQKWSLVSPASELVTESQPQLISQAAERFEMEKGRVELVLDHLVNSITQPDPRLRNRPSQSRADAAGESATNCTALDARLAPLDNLQKALPVRNVQATVRNVVDFGAFVDFGGERDGLLHRSRLGNRVDLRSLLVGQSIGVDILGASMRSNKVSVSLAGLGLPKEDLDSSKRGMHTSAKPSKGSSAPPKAKRRRIAKS